MDDSDRNRAFHFSLAGVFGVMTFIACFLAAGRVIGYFAVICLLAAPWPVICYLRLVRSVMHRTSVDSQSWLVFENLVLMAGLVFFSFVGIGFLVAGVASTMNSSVSSHFRHNGANSWKAALYPRP